MRVYELWGEGIINYFLVSLVDILGRMEVIKILGFLVLEGRNHELENFGYFIDVVPWPSSEIAPGTSTTPLPSKRCGL